MLAGLQLPLDLPQDLFSSKLTPSEKETLVQLVLSRIEQRVPVAYLTNSAWFCGLEFMWMSVRLFLAHQSVH